MRPLRFCDVCGGLDDHPRHRIAMRGDTTDARPSDEFLDSLNLGDAPVSAIEEILAGNVLIRHIDCCASKGCPVCSATEELTGGARGDELVDVIAGGALDDFDPPDFDSREVI